MARVETWRFEKHAKIDGDAQKNWTVFVQVSSHGHTRIVALKANSMAKKAMPASEEKQLQLPLLED